MKKIMMNDKILNVIHAVLAYRRFLVEDARVKGIEGFNWYERTRDYYASLDLPEGMRKNTEDFENVLRYGDGPGKKLLAELDDLDEVEMAETECVWRVASEDERKKHDDVGELIEKCKDVNLYNNPAVLDALNEKIAQLRKDMYDFWDAGDEANASKAEKTLARLEEAYNEVWGRPISEAADKQKWTDYLSQDVDERLANCVSRKADLQELVDAKWAFYQQTGKAEEGFTKEDALVDVLELLDCNSCYFDLTKDEYDELCGKSKGVDGLIASSTERAKETESDSRDIEMVME